MPKAYLPELMWNYSPVIKPMPPLLLDDVCGDKQVCVSFACDFIPYLLGLLEIYRWPDRFSGTPEEQAHSAGLFRELMEVLAMACCGDGTSSITQIVLHQVNSITLALEISVDGGQTWTPDPNGIPAQITEQVPAVTSGVSANKCDAASNGKQHLEDWIAGVSTAFDVYGTFFEWGVQVILVIAGIILWLLSAGALTVAEIAVIEAIAGALHGVFSAGKSYWDEYWTSDERDKLLCALYCNIGDDGSFDDSGQQRVISSLQSDLTTGPAKILMIAMLGLIGRQGLNNMCSYGASAEADCTSCGCDTCGDDWVIGSRFNAGGAPIGHIDSFGVDEDTGRWYFVVSSRPDGFDSEAVFLTSGDSNNCCNVNASDMQFLSGAATVTGYVECGHALTDWHFGWLGTVKINSLDLAASAGNPFTVKVFFNVTS